MSLTKDTVAYGVSYPEFVAITEEHEKAHWHVGEAKLQQDVEQWKTGVITEDEKYFATVILRLFTQADCAVATDYYDNLIPVFKRGEVRDMLGSFAGREGTHKRAYALLTDTLGFGDKFYEEFLAIDEMKRKIDFMMDMRNSTPHELALSLAKQVLAEGVCLFGPFAMLLNFPRHGKLIGAGDINQWSIRDESIHVKGLSLLFREYIKEHPYLLTDDFKFEVYQAARDAVQVEDDIADIAFLRGGVAGISLKETKQYVRAVADYRMLQLGFKAQFNVDNPFTWLDWVTSGNMIENFFENTTVGYSKNSMVGSYGGGY